MANNKNALTIEQVRDFIAQNEKNADILREVRDLCKDYLKDVYAEKKEQRIADKAASLQAWKEAQEKLPMATEELVGKNGKKWLVITNCYKCKDEIKAKFKGCWYASSKKGFAVSMDEKKAVMDFIKAYK